MLFMIATCGGGACCCGAPARLLVGFFANTVRSWQRSIVAVELHTELDAGTRVRDGPFRPHQGREEEEERPLRDPSSDGGRAKAFTQMWGEGFGPSSTVEMVGGGGREALSSRGIPARDPNSHIYLVDPASSHMLVSKIKPCMSQYRPNFEGETANGSLNQLWFIGSYPFLLG